MAFDIFLTTNPVIPGESTQPRFVGAIEVMSYNWGLTNPATIGSAGSGAGAGKVKFNELNITKAFDKSSPLLMQYLEGGKHFTNITLTLRRAGSINSKQQSQTFLTYVFGEVFVTSISDAGNSGGDEFPVESISFAMGSVQVKYTPQNANGSSGTPVTSGWNITKNQAA